MPDFIFLMHSDTRSEENYSDWELYIQKLNACGQFRGGSSIGRGQSFRNGSLPVLAAGHINGFIRIEAADLEDAQKLLEGNPTFNADGTVEIREIIED